LTPIGTCTSQSIQIDGSMIVTAKEEPEDDAVLDQALEMKAHASSLNYFQISAFVILACIIIKCFSNN
jgi:hypothetical protein